MTDMEDARVMISALTASRDYMEMEMEFYKSLYRRLYDQLGKAEEPERRCLASSPTFGIQCYYHEGPHIFAHVGDIVLVCKCGASKEEE